MLGLWSCFKRHMEEEKDSWKVLEVYSFIVHGCRPEHVDFQA